MSQQTYSSGLLFSKAYKLVRGHVYALLEQYQLNPSYWSILGITMEAQDGVRMSTVAEKMGVKPPMVTMLADYLIEKDLIRRLPHPTDGRAKLLVMTPQGKKLAFKVETEMANEVARQLHGADTEEIQAFRRVLQIIIRNSS